MKVSHGNNPYAHQQQRTHGNGKDKGFADMLVGMAYNKHGEPEKQVKLDKCSFHTHMVNPRKDHGTQVRPDKEWLNTVGQPNAESKGDKELTGSQIHFLGNVRKMLMCDIMVIKTGDIDGDSRSKVPSMRTDGSE